MAYLKYKIEKTEDLEVDNRKLRRDQYLNTLFNSIENGWKYKKEKKGLLKEQKLILNKYAESMLAENKNHLSVVQLTRDLMRVGSLIKKPFSQYTEDDIKKYLSNLKISGCSEETITNKAVSIRLFFRWHYKGDATIKKDARGYPELVDWVKVKRKGKKIQPSELLTIQDIENLVKVATNDRDRLIPIALYETGCRVEEFINIKFKDVTIEGEGDNQIMYIDVEGKTGKRTVMCKHAIPYYQKLIENYPYEFNSNLPVIINTKFTKPDFISTGFLGVTLKKMGRCAGIKKKIYNHLFRHSRATELSQHMSESEMRIYFGWSKTSDMPTNYIHINNQNVKNKIKSIYGIKTEEKKELKDNLFRTKICGCGYTNPTTQVFCSKCGKELIRKTVQQEKIDNVKKVLDYGMNSPETKDKLANLLTEIVKSMQK
ncbi:MAG: tyrosine-type recombinase/integrase [Nanoarchaeota archaeon]